MAVTAVNLVGRGRIGAPVAEWLRGASAYRLGQVIGRGASGWTPAPLAIETAGPGALRDYGPRLLAEGDLWSVGAVALTDPGFRDEMAAVARESGHRLRFFTGWVGGVNLMPVGAGRLHITQESPRLGPGPVSRGKGWAG